MNTSFPRTFAGVLSTLTVATLVVAGSLASIVATAPPASGLVQLEVTSNGDSGVGSLRDMIGFANGVDDDVEIVIPASVGDITLTTGELLADTCNTRLPRAHLHRLTHAADARDTAHQAFWRQFPTAVVAN